MDVHDYTICIDLVIMIDMWKVDRDLPENYCKSYIRYYHPGFTDSHREAYSWAVERILESKTQIHPTSESNMELRRKNHSREVKRKNWFWNFVYLPYRDRVENYLCSLNTSTIAFDITESWPSSSAFAVSRFLVVGFNNVPLSLNFLLLWSYPAPIYVLSLGHSWTWDLFPYSAEIVRIVIENFVVSSLPGCTFMPVVARAAWNDRPRLCFVRHKVYNSPMVLHVCVLYILYL